MAKLIIDDEEHEVSDGVRIDEICEDAGIPFSCNSGVCGTCQVRVLEGMDNLSKLNDEENDLGLDRENRLSCQCSINSGTVKITY